MPRPVALVNARLVDPAQGTQTRGGVLAVGGLIADLGQNVTAAAAPEGALVVDCGGDVVAPGLVDLRAFVGEPGAEYRETLASASAAAAAGGVTTIVARPDASPPVDDPAVVDFLMRRARDARVRILPCAAITKGLAGAEMAEIGLLKEAGAVAFSNGPHSIRDSGVLRRAMAYARDFDALILHFCEDRGLAGGVAAEGAFASLLGLPGVSREAETIVLDRDLRLAALTRARYHCELVSNDLSVAAMARAKSEGLAVTCGVSINHLTLNEIDLGEYRTFLKFRPPLRGEAQRQALVQGLADGVIDVIVSDHEGQDVETKRLPFAEAAPGAVGLETLLPAALRLVQAGALTLPQLLRAMSTRPAEILGLDAGRLRVGAPADLIRFDPDAPFVMDPATLRSRCRNTPFDGARMDGVVKLTLVAGEVAYL
jgi:dihydroorotase